MADLVITSGKHNKKMKLIASNILGTELKLFYWKAWQKFHRHKCVGKSAKTKFLQQVLTLLIILSSCCCSCKELGNKSLCIICNLAVEAISSFSLSAQVHLPSKSDWKHSSLHCFHIPEQSFIGGDRSTHALEHCSLWKAVGLLYMHLKNTHEFFIRATTRYKLH